MAVLFSLHAQQPENADDLQKFNNPISSQKRTSISIWLQMGTKPVWGTLQLWIFLSRSITAAIDVLARRVGCEEVDHFVGDLWICQNFLLLGQALTSGDVQYFLKLDKEVLILVQSCQGMH